MSTGGHRTLPMSQPPGILEAMKSRGQGSRRAATIAVAGDVHGHWDDLVTNLDAMVDRIGPIDIVIAVGDAEAHRDWSDHDGCRKPKKYRGLGSFARVVAGEIRLPCPVAFIGGNHEPWVALDAAGPGRWGCNGVEYLGRAGTTTLAGLRVGFLSGIYSPTWSDSAPAKRPADLKTRTYWSCHDLATLRAAGPVDLLVTHEWPTGLLDGWRGRGDPGVTAMRELSERLCPALHICGHMHFPHRGRIGRTVVACMGHQTAPGGLAVFRLRPGGPAEEIASNASVAT